MSDENWANTKFFHSFGEPLNIQGIRPLEEQQRYADIVFEHPIAGLTVLDIGAWDGFFSFEAERRGARDVLATDHFCWSGPGWGSKAGFDEVHRRLGSSVRSIDVDVFQLDPAIHGTFDLVLMLGVIYHLTDPFGGLSKAAAMTKDCLVVETLSDMNNVREPVMRYYLKDEFNKDGSNFWGPNVLCLENMLRELGFTRFKTWLMHPRKKTTRIITHGWR